MIYVPKDLPKKYTAIFIVAMAQAVYDELVTTQQILNKMELNNTAYNRKLINQGIEYMISNELIMGKKVKSNRYCLYRKEIDLKSKEYYSIHYKYINSIIKIKDKCNRLDLINYFLIIKDTINHYSGVGFTSIETLSKRANCTVATIVKYNKVLQDNHILFIATSKRQGISNRYGLYKDKENVIKEARRVGIWVDNAN